MPADQRRGTTPPSGRSMQFIDRIVGDARYLKGALRTLKYVTPIAQHRGRVFPHVIDELAEKYQDAPALLSDRERFTYRERAERSHQESAPVDQNDTLTERPE